MVANHRPGQAEASARGGKPAPVYDLDEAPHRGKLVHSLVALISDRSRGAVINDI